MIYPIAAVLAFAGTLAAADCNADNCLRAFRATQTPGRLEAAQSFCATFTKTSVAATAIPTFAAKACVSNQVGSPDFRISSACGCIGTATASATITTITPTATLQACGIVSSLSSAYKVASPAATPTIPASIAHDCLNSVPLNTESALKLMDSLKPYLEWQSDPAYLKNPPADQYFYPGYDLFAQFDSIVSKLNAGSYVNEYAFQQELYQIFAPAHDGHFVMYPDLLSKALQWGRKLPLVSVSKDGEEIPKIYAYNDVIASPTLENATEIVQINGEKASKYIEDWAAKANYDQDVDANYNGMFFGKATQAAGAGFGYFFMLGRVRYVYPGANTTFVYADGTTRVDENVAQVKGNFDGVTDGPSFYKKFCTGPVQPKEAATDAAPAAALAGIPNYPEPVIASSDNVVTGYYLDGEGVDNVAVLALLDFSPDDPVEFQSTAQDFLVQAKAAGKTKLVIDLSANGGGYIFLGYDLFRQLFPDIVQRDYNRIRENPTFNAMSKAISNAFPADFNPYTSGDADLIGAWETWFNYRYDNNFTGQPFLTYEDKFAPHYAAGDAYTNLMRWNFNDNLTTTNTTYGLGTDITGYGSRTNFTQHFAAEDIIMVYDGGCASTCVLFSEFMRLDGKVKSVMFGGRPNKEVVQAVGGVKGAQVLSFPDIKYYGDLASSLTNDTEILDTLSELNTYATDRSSATSINFRDLILADHVNDGLPAQFVYEAADCRLFYTPPMITDVEAIWTAAAGAAWNGGKCVSGGGLAKREAEPDNRARLTAREMAEDKVMRSQMLKRITTEKGTPLFDAKYGRKVIA